MPGAWGALCWTLEDGQDDQRGVLAAARWKWHAASGGTLGEDDQKDVPVAVILNLCATNDQGDDSHGDWMVMRECYML